MSGDLLKFIGFPPKLLHLRGDLIVLTMDAVQERRDLLIYIVFQWLLQIQAVQGLHDLICHPAGKQRRKADSQHCNKNDGPQHPNHQKPRRFLAGGYSKHSSILKPLSFIKSLLGERRGCAHSAAESGFQSLPDLLTVGMIRHKGLVHPCVKEDRAICINPGHTETVRFHLFQERTAELLRTGNRKTQFILQLLNLNLCKMVI